MTLTQVIKLRAATGRGFRASGATATLALTAWPALCCGLVPELYPPMMRLLTHRAALAPALAAALLAAMACAPAAARQVADEWQFIVNFPMAWLPDISGEIDSDGESTEVEISINDILSNLDAGFIGELYARKGHWGFGWRSMFLGVQDKITTQSVGLPGRPPIVGKQRLQINWDLFTSDLIVDYLINDYVGIYSGIRRTGTKVSMRVEALEPGLIEVPGRIEFIDDELFDWVLGVSLEYPLGAKWTAALQLDTLLTGDNDSNNQLNTFFSYHINPRHNVWFGYRYLRISQSSSSEGSRVEQDFTQQGPTLGWAFTF